MIKHSKQFWTDKFKEYKKSVKAIGGTALKKNAFISSYKSYMEENAKLKLRGEKPLTPMKELVYGSRYGTKMSAVRAEYNQLKSIGIKVKMADLKEITTTDFAARYSAEIMNFYKDSKAKGKTAAEAKLLISQVWFGSK